LIAIQLAARSVERSRAPARVVEAAGWKYGDLAYVIEFRASRFDQTREAVLSEVAHMLAEKFFLVLETLRSQGYPEAYPDGGPIVVSATRHVPIKLPAKSGK
jgi:hypothetical protein